MLRKYLTGVTLSTFQGNCQHLKRALPLIHHLAIVIILGEGFVCASNADCNPRCRQ